MLGAIAAHFARLQRLTKEGVVLFAGPCTHQIGPGVVIFETESEEAALRFMNEDPAVAAGVFTARVRPINFPLLRERDRL